MAAQNSAVQQSLDPLDPVTAHAYDISEIRFVDSQRNGLPNVAVVKRSTTLQLSKYLNRSVPFDDRISFISNELGLARIVDVSGELWRPWVAYKAGFAPARFSLATVPAEVVLTSGVSFDGQVVDEDDHPVSGANVWLFYFGDRVNTLVSLYGSAVRVGIATDRQGNFVLNHLPYSRFAAIAVEKPGFVSTVYQIKIDHTSRRLGNNPNLPLLETGSKLVLERASQVQIEYIAEDSGQSIATRNEKWQASSQHSEQFEIPNHEPGLPPLKLFAGAGQEFRVYAMAQANQPYVGRWTDVEFPDSNELLELNEQLSRGTIIRGRAVDHETELPINGVLFGYGAPRKHFNKNRWYVPSQKSDADGRFQMVVPPVKGGIQCFPVAGHGYKATTNWITVDASNTPDEIEVEFRLVKIPPVVGVVKSAGLVVPRARYAIVNPTIQKARIGVTDELGRFSIEGIPRQTPHPPIPPFGVTFSPAQKAARDPRTKILFWDEDGANGAVVFPQDSPGDQDQVELDVDLKPTCVLIGKVVDSQTGDPVSNVRIHTTIDVVSGSFGNWIHGLVPDSLSDNNGNFHCYGMPGDLPVILDFRKPGVIFNRPLVDRLTKSGETMDYGTISCDVMPDFSVVEVAVPNTQGMDARAQFEALSKSIDDLLSKIPNVNFVSNNILVGAYRYRIAAKFAPELLEIAAANAGSELEFRILMALFEKLYHKPWHWDPDEPWMKSARRMLVQSHLNHPDLGAKLFRYFDEDDPLLPQVLEQATSNDVQGIACVRLLKTRVDQLIQLTKTSLFDERKFTEVWDETHQLMKKAFSPECAHVKEPGKSDVESRAKACLIQLSNHLRNCWNWDEEVVQSANDAIQSQLRQPAKPRKPF